MTIKEQIQKKKEEIKALEKKLTEISTIGKFLQENDFLQQINGE
jgi:5-bromo-4-chloroindolyl phosphate hydrolysis protein